MQCHLLMFCLTTAWCKRKYFNAPHRQVFPYYYFLSLPSSVQKVHFILPRRRVLPWSLPQIACILLGDVMMIFCSIYLYLCSNPSILTLSKWLLIVFMPLWFKTCIKLTVLGAWPQINQYIFSSNPFYTHTNTYMPLMWTTLLCSWWNRWFCL